MEHFIFLVQILSLMLGILSLVIIMQIYLKQRDSSLLLLSSALFLMLLRTVIFAIVRYGNISSFFIFSVRFPVHFSGGLVYVSLVFISHFMLLFSISRLAKIKISIFVYTLLILISLYSMGLFISLMNGVRISIIPYSWLGVNGLAVIPVLAVKTIILLSGFFLFFKVNQKRTVGLFILLICFWIIADGVFYAFDFWRPFTLVMTLLLPYTAFLFILPALYDSDLETLISRFAMEQSLNEEEVEIIRAIEMGMSNKEIAYERGTTLSVTKHKIYRLYKKCNINSRWELLYKLHSYR